MSAAVAVMSSAPQCSAWAGTFDGFISGLMGAPWAQTLIRGTSVSPQVHPLESQSSSSSSSSSATVSGQRVLVMSDASSDHVASGLRAHLTERNLAVEQNAEHYRVAVTAYMDRCPCVEHPGEDATRGADVVFLASITDNDSLGNAYQLLNSMLEMGTMRSFTLVVTTFPFGTEDRSEGSSAGRRRAVTSRHALQQLDDALSKGKCPTDMYICDPHTPHLCNYVRSRVVKPVDLMEPMVQAVLADAALAGERVCLVMPDLGANKRYEVLTRALGAEKIVCGKSRGGDGSGAPRCWVSDHEAATTSTTTAPERTRCIRFVIMDDMIRSGGTLLACIEAVRTDAKFGDADAKFSIIATHANLVPGAVDKLRAAHVAGAIDRIHVADTHAREECPLFRVHPCAPALGARLFGSLQRL